MNQCVPSWSLENSPHQSLALSSHSNSNNSFVNDVPPLNYEVAELTWENGQLGMHGLGPPREPNNKPSISSSPIKYTWDNKSHVGGTLESIVNQATGIPYDHQKFSIDGGGDREEDVDHWFNKCVADTRSTTTTVSVAMNNLVPSLAHTQNSHQGEQPPTHVYGITTCLSGGSTHMTSCSGVVNTTDGEMLCANTGAAYEEISKDLEITAYFGKQEVKNLICGPLNRRTRLNEEHSDVVLSCMADQSVSWKDNIDTSERDLGAEKFTSTSMSSVEKTSFAKQCNNKTVDEHDFICHNRSQRPEAGDEDDKKKRSKTSLFSRKRSRAAATHNQSERKRRNRINQRMKTLQKLVPYSSKTNKASMLDEVIEYLKQLQAQVQAMSRMNNNMSPMMLQNMAMQQQQQQHLQMSMMASMGMGMGMAGFNGALSHPNITAVPSLLHPTASFMPIPSGVSPGSGDRNINAASTSSLVPDPLAAFRTCQSQGLIQVRKNNEVFGVNNVKKTSNQEAPERKETKSGLGWNPPRPR